jgi:hypothetical protein
MEYPNPYLLGGRQTSDDTTTKSESFAPSESDCSTLMDLKKRVRELDCLLNDLSSNRSDENEYAHDDEEEDSSILVVDEENGIPSEQETIDDNGEDSVILGAPVDMVHTLSSLFFRQPAVSIHNELQEAFGGGEAPNISFTIDGATNNATPIETNRDTTQVEKHGTLLFMGRLVLLLFGIFSLGVMVAYIVLKRRSVL